MWFKRFSQALSLCLLAIGFAMDPGISASPGLLHQLLSTGAPAWAVEQALEWGADPNVDSAFFPGRNALHLAAEVGTVEQLALVAAQARGLNVLTATGDTALTLALEQDDWLERLRVLLEAGADPNVVDARGRYPLALAASKGGAAGRMPDEAATGVRWLLEHGADPNMVMVDGVPLLELVLSFGPPTELLDELLASGLRIDPVRARAGWDLVLSAGEQSLGPELVQWWRDADLEAAAGDDLLQMVRGPGGGLIRE